MDVDTDDIRWFDCWDLLTVLSPCLLNLKMGFKFDMATRSPGTHLYEWGWSCWWQFWPLFNLKSSWGDGMGIKEEDVGEANLGMWWLMRMRLVVDQRWMNLMFSHFLDGWRPNLHDVGFTRGRFQLLVGEGNDDNLAVENCQWIEASDRWHTQGGERKKEKRTLQVAHGILCFWFILL